MIEMKVENHFHGATNFSSWNSRVHLILEENDLLNLVNEKVPETVAKEDKSHWRKSDAIARIILVDSVGIIWFLKSHKIRRRLGRCSKP